MSSTLELEVTTVNGTTVVTLVGELDDSTSGLLDGVLDHLCDEGVTDLHIDAWRLVVDGASSLAATQSSLRDRGTTTTVRGR